MSEVMWKDDSGLGGGRVGRGEGEFRGWIDKGEEEEKMGVICYTLVSGIEKSECCSEVQNEKMLFVQSVSVSEEESFKSSHIVISGDVGAMTTF